MKGKIRTRDILMMLGMGFTLTGIMLTVYCNMYRIPIGDVAELSNPFWYLMMGMNFFIVYLFDRYGFMEESRV